MLHKKYEINFFLFCGKVEIFQKYAQGSSFVRQEREKIVIADSHVTKKKERSRRREREAEMQHNIIYEFTGRCCILLNKRLACCSEM